MTKCVTFHFSLLSPWVYFSGPRFHEIVQRTGATVEYRPIDLLRVFRETGGTPLAQLHPSRRAYRAAERERWSQLLGVPVSDKPRFHPADESTGARMLIAADRAGLHAQVWPLAHTILAAVWVRDLDIADPDTLVRLAGETGLDGADLLAKAREPACAATYESYTAEAMNAGVFGVPTFAVDHQLYFGQDRLDFVERALAAQ